MSNKNKWEALSMKDRAFLIREGIRKGITDLNEIRNLYNESHKLGVPYRTFEAGSDYDYYNASPENMPENSDGHWTSRNPYTGQILKSKDHPTYHKTIQGEKNAGYEIKQIGDREYSFPKGSHQFSGNNPIKINSPIISRNTSYLNNQNNTELHQRHSVIPNIDNVQEYSGYMGNTEYFIRKGNDGKFMYDVNLDSGTSFQGENENNLPQPLIDSSHNTYNRYNSKMHQFSGENSVVSDFPEGYTPPEYTYRSPEVYESVMDYYWIPWVQKVENDVKKGYDKNTDTWTPHKSAEPGSDTIGYGFKLSAHPELVQMLKNNNNRISTADLNKYAKKVYLNNFAATAKIWNDRYGEDKSFEKLPPELQVLLADKQYNVQNGGLTTYPKFMEAVANEQFEDMIREGKVNMKNSQGSFVPLGRNHHIENMIRSLQSRLEAERANGLPGVFWNPQAYIVRHEYSGEENTDFNYYPTERMSDGDLAALKYIQSIAIADYNPRNEQGELLRGRDFRQQARIDAAKLLEQGVTPEEFGYLKTRTKNNARLNRVYGRQARRQAYENRRDNRIQNTRNFGDLLVYGLSPAQDAITSYIQTRPNQDTLYTKTSNTNSRDFFNDISILSNAFGRGTITYDQIPELYRPYIAKTRFEQQKRWEKQLEEEERFNQIMNEKGWDKLEKAYGIGMSSLLGGAWLSSTLGGAAMGDFSLEAAKEALEQELKYLSPNKELAKKVFKDILTGIIVGETVNQGVKTFTDNSWGQNMVKLLPDFMQEMPFIVNNGEAIGDFTNPFYLTSWDKLANTVGRLSGVSAKNLFTPAWNQIKTGAVNLSKKGQDVFSKVKEGIKEYNPFTLNKRIAKLEKEIPELQASYNRSLKSSMAHLTGLRRDTNIKYGQNVHKPFFSNDVTTIEKYVPKGAQVTRETDRVIKISIPNTSRRNFNPKLKLPKGDETKVFLQNAVDDNNQFLEYTLTYPKGNKGGTPSIDVSKISLKDMNHMLSNQEYYQLPDEVIEAMINEKNIAFSQIPGANNTNQVKLFGSMATASKGTLPTISDDVDVMMSKSYYDTYVKDKLPLWEQQKTRGGVTLSYEINGTRKPLDVVLIENGVDGFADSNNHMAWELFAKQNPIQYHKILQEAALSQKAPKIPISAEDLMKNVDPYFDTIFDAFIAANTENKLKHLGRVPLFMERADVNTLRKVIERKGQLFFGEGYKPISNINYNDIEANIKFLQEIGYTGEHLYNLASNPERMELVVQDYYQYLSSASRSSSIPFDMSRTKASMDQVATQWAPSVMGGVGYGGFKNTVSLGSSGYSRGITSNMQLDLSLYLPENATPDILPEFHKELRGQKPFSETRKKSIENIIHKLPGYDGVEIKNSADLLRWGQDFYMRASKQNPDFTQKQVDQLMADLAEILPYAEGMPYQNTNLAYRGVIAKPNAHAFFDDFTPFMNEITFGTDQRFSALQMDNTIFHQNPLTVHDMFQPKIKQNAPQKDIYRVNTINDALKTKSQVRREIAQKRYDEWINAEKNLRLLNIRKDDLKSIMAVISAVALPSLGVVGLAMRAKKTPLPADKDLAKFFQSDRVKALRKLYSGDEYNQKLGEEYEKWLLEKEHKFSGESNITNNNSFWGYLKQYLPN